MLRIEEIKNEVLTIGAKIGIDEKSLLYPAFSPPDKVFNEGASIYVTSTQYHYIIMERGREIKHYKSESLEDILYPLFRSITLALATKYELDHRNINEDSRKLRWKKQLELLETINVEFCDMRKKEIEEILKIAPYKDKV